MGTVSAFCSDKETRFGMKSTDGWSDFSSFGEGHSLGIFTDCGSVVGISAFAFALDSAKGCSVSALQDHFANK